MIMTWLPAMVPDPVRPGPRTAALLLPGPHPGMTQRRDGHSLKL